MWGSLIVIFLLGAAYFLPALVAGIRHKRNFAAIFVLNFFLGWTLVGWVLALVWAATVDKPEPVMAPQPPAGPVGGALG